MAPHKLRFFYRSLRLAGRIEAYGFVVHTLLRYPISVALDKIQEKKREDEEEYRETKIADEHRRRA